ncbi:MAG TPA: GAF domain-containing protein [Flavobacteriales bacterium]|nr:GAF domain-containing protein [Flavobacteriales bacterium]
MNDKVSKYNSLLSQINSLVDREVGLIANLANISAAIKEEFDFLWIGFYLVSGNELQLGPFQGPVACTKIAYGKGVCGSSWKKEEILIVDDVQLYPGHISCNEAARSEIVLPVRDKAGKVLGVLDIDSKEVAGFDATDNQYLSQVVKAIESIL